MDIEFDKETGMAKWDAQLFRETRQGQAVPSVGQALNVSRNLDEAGRTPLMFALRYNRISSLGLSPGQLMELARGSDLMVSTGKGWTPLIYALRRNRDADLGLSSDQVMELAHGSDLKAATTDGWTPLMFALRHNQDQSLGLSSGHLMELARGSDLKAVDKDGCSPLMFALRYNQEESLGLSADQFLELARGSDLNATDNDGWTLLMFALRYGREQNLVPFPGLIMELARGSDLKATGTDGHDARSLAEKHAPDAVSVIERLLEASAEREGRMSALRDAAPFAAALRQSLGFVPSDGQVRSLAKTLELGSEADFFGAVSSVLSESVDLGARRLQRRSDPATSEQMMAASLAVDDWIAMGGVSPKPAASASLAVARASSALSRSLELGAELREKRWKDISPN